MSRKTQPSERARSRPSARDASTWAPRAGPEPLRARRKPTALAASAPSLPVERRRSSARTASTRRPSARAATAAGTFAALGDATRLSLLTRLGQGQRCSIAQLTHGSHLTRQAITKHLRVLERARIVRCVRAGRERLFELDPQPVHELRDYLTRISAEWDEALARLKSMVESSHRS